MLRAIADAIPDPQAVLGALVRLAQEDDLAARAPFCKPSSPASWPSAGAAESVVGGRLVGHGRPFGSAQELCTDIVSIAYERIRSGVDRNCPWPTTKILDHTWMHIRTLGRIHRRLTLVETSPCAIPCDLAARQDRTTAEQLATALIDATPNGTLPHRDAALLYTNRVLGHPIADIAHLTGHHPNSLRRNRQRAEQTLLQAAS